MSERNELVVAAEHAPAIHTERDTYLSDRARQRITDGVAPNTRGAYARQWAAFTAWCARTGRVSLPATAETLAEYVTVLADHGVPPAAEHPAELDEPSEAGASPATIEQAMAAVRTMHRTAGHPGQPDTSASRLVLRDHRRSSGRRTKKAAPATIDPLRAMVATCDPTTLKGLRDRVVLVLGFAVFGRRSELVALELGDLTETEDGLEVLIRASKTDQDAKGVVVTVPYGQHAETCPVRVVRAWRAALAEHDITGGRLLRSITRHGRIGASLSAKAIRDDIVLPRAAQAGLENPETYSAHSLRAGGPSAAYRAGAPVSAITQHGRWADGSPVVLGYIRVEDQWRNNPIRGIGL